MAHIAFSKGGEASIVDADDDRVRLLSTVSSAPGSRLEGTLPSGGDVRVKVHRCVRVAEGFEISGRLLDARREVRDEIAALKS